MRIRKWLALLGLLSLVSGVACAAPEGVALPLWREEFVRREMMEWRLSLEQIEVRDALGRAEAIRQATRQELSRIGLAATACPGQLSGPPASGSLTMRNSLRAALKERPLAGGGMAPLVSLEQALIAGLDRLDQAEELLAGGEPNAAHCPRARRLLGEVRAGLKATSENIRAAAIAADLPIELWPGAPRDDPRGSWITARGGSDVERG